MRPKYCFSAIAINAFALILIAHAQLNFEKVVIDSNFAMNSRPSDIVAGDLNGDTEIDLALSAPDFVTGNDILLWYRNNGSENFTKITLDTTVDVPDRLNLFGYDIVVGSFSDGLLLFTNDGSGNFTKSIIDPGIITRLLYTVDLDNDADYDIVALDNRGIFWENNDGNQNFIRDTLDTNPVVDHGLFATDLDEDADNDIISAVFGDSGEHILVWYQNDGNQNFTKDTIDMQEQTITEIFVDDLDEDGDKDIILTESENNSVLWYRNDGNESFTRDTVSVDFNRAPTRFSVADIDNDLDKDVIVTGGNNNVGEVVYYENDGNEVFTKRIVDNSSGNRKNMAVIDIDQDGDLDLFVTNAVTSELVFYRNDGPTAVRESDSGIPNQFALLQNYPNPFNPVTTIEFSLSEPGKVTLTIYNLIGQPIKILVDSELPAGKYKKNWNAQGVASGIYFYRLRSGGFSAIKKLILLR